MRPEGEDGPLKAKVRSSKRGGVKARGRAAGPKAKGLTCGALFEESVRTPKFRVRGITMALGGAVKVTLAKREEKSVAGRGKPWENLWWKSGFFLLRDTSAESEVWGSPLGIGLARRTRQNDVGCLSILEWMVGPVVKRHTGCTSCWTTVWPVKDGLASQLVSYVSEADNGMDLRLRHHQMSAADWHSAEHLKPMMSL